MNQSNQLPEFKDYLNSRRKQIAKTLRDLRKKQGWNQIELAEYLGCSRSRIVRIEKGEGTYSLEEIEILARIFEIPLEQLVGNPPIQLKRLYELEIENQRLRELVAQQEIVISTLRNSQTKNRQQK